MSNINTHKMLDAVITTSTSSFEPFAGSRLQNTFWAYGTTSAGSGAAVILVEVSNAVTPTNTTNVDWITAGTITLTLGTTQTSDGFAMNAAWRHVRARVSSISGTDATVTLMRGA